MFARFHAKLSNRLERPKTAPPLASQGSSRIANQAVDERERGHRHVVSLQLTCAAVDSRDSPGIISVRDYTRRQSESAAVMSTANLLGHASVASQASQPPVPSHSVVFPTAPPPPAEQRGSNMRRGQPQLQPVIPLNADEPNALGLYEPLDCTPPTASFPSGANIRPGELRVSLAAAQSVMENTPSSTFARMAAVPSATAPAYTSTAPPIGHSAAPRSRLKRMRSITHVPERPLLHPYVVTSTTVVPSTKSGDGALFNDSQGFDRHVKFRAGTKEEDGVPRTKAARRARISREKLSMESALADDDAMPTQNTLQVLVRPATAVSFQPQSQLHSRLADMPLSSRPVTSPPLRPHSVDTGGQALSAYGIRAREVDRAPFVPAKFIPRGYAPERGRAPAARSQAAPMARYSETETDWQKKEARMAVHIVSDVHGAETLHDWMAGARYAYTAGIPVSGQT